MGSLPPLGQAGSEGRSGAAPEGIPHLRGHGARGSLCTWHSWPDREEGGEVTESAAPRWGGAHEASALKLGVSGSSTNEVLQVP